MVRQLPGHGYASSTPVADDTGVYVNFGVSGAVAFDHNGKVRWQKHTGTGTRGFGSAASPVGGRRVCASDEASVSLPGYAGPLEPSTLVSLVYLFQVCVVTCTCLRACVCLCTTAALFGPNRQSRPIPVRFFI